MEWSQWWKCETWIEFTKIISTVSEKLLDFDKLDEKTRISYKYYEYNAQTEIDNFRWRFHNYPLNQMDGFQSAIPAFSSTCTALIQLRMLKLTSVGWMESGLFEQEIVELKIRDSPASFRPGLSFLCEIRYQNVLTGQPFDYSSRRCPLYEDFYSKSVSWICRPV